MIKLDDLEMLAKAATPGEWLTTKRSVYVLHSVDPVDGGEVVCQPKRAVDTRFIAAANPSTILDIIDRYRKLEALCKQQHEALKESAAQVKELITVFHVPSPEASFDRYKEAIAAFESFVKE